MDILFLLNLFRPVDFGGSRYPWEVTRRLAQRHRVRVVTPRLGGPLPGPTDAQLSHYPISRRTPLETFLTNAVSSRIAVSGEIRHGAPDAVVLSSYDVAYGLLAIARPMVPSVFIYHSSFHSAFVEGLAGSSVARRAAHRTLRRFMAHVERLVFERSDRIVAVSPFSRSEIVARLGRDDPKVSVVPTGVDAELFSPGDQRDARDRVGLTSDGRVLLTVGRLTPVKRYDRAIEALALLRREDPGLQLVIVGTGPSESELRALAASRGLAEHVRFEGFADGERLRDLYRSADLVLCTSEFENWSLALLEALACGIPAVGTPRGGIPELLALVADDLVAADTSADSIAAVARRLLRDGSRRRDVGAAARALAATRFSWERSVAQLESVISDATRGAA